MPAHPRDPKSDSLLSDAGRTSLPLAAALREGSAPSLASLVTNGWFLTCALCEFRRQTGRSSIGPKTVFFSNFYSITKNTTRYSIAFLVKTGPKEHNLVLFFILRSIMFFCVFAQMLLDFGRRTCVTWHPVSHGLLRFHFLAPSIPPLPQPCS